MKQRINRHGAARPTPNVTVSVRIDKVVAEGDGFGHLEDGRVIFVEGGLPGELVSARIVKQSKDYARAIAVEILEPSAQRVVPPCEYVAQGCGGCDLQHASIDLQRQIKLDIVRESLTRLGKMTAPDIRLFASGELPMTGARTTLRVAATPSGSVGFRQRQSHLVVNVEHCLVAHPSLNALLPTMHLEPADSLSGLPVDVRLGSQAIVHEVVAGHIFQISASSFFQSSPQAAEALVDATRRALGDSAQWNAGPVVDAYSGVGLFAATVFPSDRHVIAIESNPAACSDARLNLAGRDVEIVQQPVEEWAPVAAAVVVADPARDGLRASGVEVLVATQASVIVLISCDPASLGRDARLLRDKGYVLEYSEVLDVFPHTHHVEVVSRFVRDETMGNA